MFLRLLIMIGLATLAAPAQASTVTVDGNSYGMNNCIPFGGSYNSFGPYMGFIYQNVPAFSLAAGDTIAFDLGAENDQTIIMDIALATTSSNGSNQEDSNGFTTIVSSGTPADPNGNTTVGDFELEFTADNAFTFGGGGLIIRFQPQGSFQSDTSCTQVLVHYTSTDSSGYFVQRFYGDSSGGAPWDGSDTSSIGGFKIGSTDNDGDGYSGSDDCDDSDASINPGATEYCDGVDNNCDGNTDEDSAVDATTWYNDADNDGYGDATTTDVECYQPTGYVSDNTDCNDSNSSTYPTAPEYCDGVDNNCSGTTDENTAVDALTWYADADSDGYGDATSTDVECYQPTGYVADNTDCNDSNSTTYPTADEYCDGVDNNCSGTTDEDTAVDASTWYADADSDGYGNASSTDVECYQPSGYVTDATDCDDNDPSAYPGATEYCDGHDDDCDGTVDEDASADVKTWYADADSDNYGDSSSSDIDCYQPTGYVADATDCDDNDPSAYPGADEYCDGHDDNCDGDIDEDTSVDVSTWYADSDSDGYGDASTTDLECYQPSGYVTDATDCDDTDADTYPGAEEWCDGHDDNCDGITDEDDSMDSITWYIDADGDGEGDSSISGDSCYGATGYVENSTDCDDNDAVLNTSDADGDGFTSCDSDCNDGDATINTDATEIWYDGIDQNCDAWSDYDQDADGFDFLAYNGDDCDDLNPDINVDATEIWYDGTDQDCDTLSDYDADYDGQESETYGGEDCNDADPDTYTGAPDTPYDGIINDCDNANDNDADGDGAISADYGGKDCDDANSDINPSAEEIWYDGVDQDCDGNDDDQDGDGYALDADCDDENADVFENCDADTGGDTGGSDTGDGTDTLDKDSGGCFSSTTGGTPVGPWALMLAGLLFFRRREA